MPTRRQALPSLTSLRFFAALWVVLLHAGSLLSTLPLWLAFRSTGYLGVSFFFVLSGFVLTWSLNGSRTRTRFYWLRFARVWPLHAVTTVAAAVVPGTWHPPGAAGAVEIVAGLHAWDPRGHVHYGLNGVSWSLSCEAFFYLAFPFLVPPLQRLTQRGLAALSAAVLAAMLLLPWATTGGAVGATHDDPDWLWFNFPPYRLGEFVLGVTAALAFSRGWRPRMTLRAPLFAVGLWLTVPVALRLEHADLPRHYVTWPLVPCFVAVLVVAAGRDLSGRSGVLGSRALVFLGETSFALYLVHQLLFRLLPWTRDGAHASAVGFAGYLATAVLAAAGLHLGVERPVERWLRARRVGEPPAVGRHRKVVAPPAAPLPPLAARTGAVPHQPAAVGPRADVRSAPGAPPATPVAWAVAPPPVP